MADDLTDGTRAEPGQAAVPPVSGGWEAGAGSAFVPETERADARGEPQGGDDRRGDAAERRRDRGQRRGSGARFEREGLAEEGEVSSTVVRIYRCATVVRGGRRFSFGALVVAGDRRGRVGVGYGKANEVPNAVEKATKLAIREMVEIPLAGTTIPHRVLGRFGASKVVLVPAGEGTGVIAGDSVRSVMELAGVKNILTKSYGSNSPKNLVKAAFAGLRALRSKDQVRSMREVSMA